MSASEYPKSPLDGLSTIWLSYAGEILHREHLGPASSSKEKDQHADSPGSLDEDAEMTLVLPPSPVSEEKNSLKGKKWADLSPIAPSPLLQPSPAVKNEINLGLIAPALPSAPPTALPIRQQEDPKAACRAAWSAFILEHKWALPRQVNTAAGRAEMLASAVRSKPESADAMGAGHAAIKATVGALDAIAKWKGNHPNWHTVVDATGVTSTAFIEAAGKTGNGKRRPHPWRVPTPAELAFLRLLGWGKKRRGILSPKNLERLEKAELQHLLEDEKTVPPFWEGWSQEAEEELRLELLGVE